MMIKVETIGSGKKCQIKQRALFLLFYQHLALQLMNVFVKLAGDLPSFQKSFFRNLVALIFAAIILIRTEEKFQFNKKNLPVLFIRSLMGTIGIVWQLLRN